MYQSIISTIRQIVGIIAVSLIASVLLVFIANYGATIWLRNHPSFLMSEADRINENTRAIREKMISPENAKLWYQLKAAEEVKPMWDEFYNAGIAFESYVHFRSKTYLGKYYGVTEPGYRLSRDPGPWPPSAENFNVFFFGGSTSFGVGPYWATVASYLQDAMNESGKLKRKVYAYNFGRSGYISTQEQILFHRLISEGYRPNMVVFLDGLNDFCMSDGRPSSWQMLRDPFEKANAEYSQRLAGYGIVTKWGDLMSFLGTMPLMRLTAAAIERTSSAPLPTYTGSGTFSDDVPADKEVLLKVIDRYTNNMKQVKAVSQAYGITPVFVWQPIPSYKYDVSYHLFNPNRLGCHINSKVGYPMMVELSKKSSLGASFIWAADIQAKRFEPLYVDAFHYTAPLSKSIAEFINSAIIERKLIGIGVE